jgi:hypothetical protein
LSRARIFPEEKLMKKGNKKGGESKKKEDRNRQREKL